MQTDRLTHGEGVAKCRAAGYKAGGRVEDEREDMREDKREVASGVHRHEKHMHRGEPETKLKHGGHVKGEAPTSRMDKRARGGRTGAKNVTVNVISAHPPGGSMGAPGGALPIAGPPPMPPRPMPQPGAGIAGGMPPPGAMPMRPPSVMKQGGRITSKVGSGSAQGRLEKA